MVWLRLNPSGGLKWGRRTVDMPSMEKPNMEKPSYYPSGEEVGAKALEAVKVGMTLNADHRADPGSLRSIGTCRICGILSYQANDGTWKHVPAIEECEGADAWIRRHQLLVSARSSESADARLH
jgi:hypothetical protein